MTGLITGADLAAVTRPLRDGEGDRPVKLAGFAARARTAVERDGYTHDVLVIPQAEGPGRLVTALRRLYGGLEAIGVAEPDRWTIVSRVAIHCAPAGRMQAARELLKVPNGEQVKTSRVATRAGLATKTAGQYLDDLVMLGLAERAKTSEASNAPDLWSASDWLRERWPDDADRDVMPQSKSKREKQYRGDVGLVVGDGSPPTEEEHPYLTLSPTLGPDNEDGYDFAKAMTLVPDDVSTCWQCGRELVWTDEQRSGVCSRCDPEANLWREEEATPLPAASRSPATSSTDAYPTVLSTSDAKPQACTDPHTPTRSQ